MSQLALLAITLVSLDILAPTASPGSPVYPQQSNGFAAYIVGGFFGLGVLILVTIWISNKPKPPRARREPGLND
jgi:hypothetical protein